MKNRMNARECEDFVCVCVCMLEIGEKRLFITCGLYDFLILVLVLLNSE